MRYFFLILILGTANLSHSQNVDSLLNLLKNAKHDTLKLRYLVELSEECDNPDIYKYAQPAVLLADKLLVENPSLPQKPILQKKALALNNIGYMYDANGRTKIAMDYFYKALKLRKEIGDQYGISETLGNIGASHQKLGELHEAFYYMNQSLNIKIEIKDKAGIALTLNNIGTIFDNQGRIKEAIDYHHRALKIREEIGEQYEIANSLHNIAYTLNLQGQVAEALKYNRRALKIREKIKHKKGIASTLNNIGGIYGARGENDTALQYYNRSLEIYEQIQDKKGTAYVLNNIGIIYNKQAKELRQQRASPDSIEKEVKKALAFLQRSLKLNTETKDKLGISNSLGHISIVLFGEKKFMQSKQYADSALALAKQSRYIERIVQTEELLSQIDSAQQNYFGAFEHYKQHIVFRDSIANKESRKLSIQKQMQYEFDKKEQTIQAEQEKKDTILEAQKRRQKIVLYSVSGGLILVIVFAGLAFRSLRITRKQNQLIAIKSKETAEQKKIIEEKNKDITDSINYAQRIQKALLASDALLNRNLGEYFVLFKPKAIVSGDFYWAVEKENRFYLAVCDSTGHGVPGAFMSLLNISFLNEAIVEKGINAPHEILNHVRQRLIENFSSEGARDGMDGVLVCFDKNKKEISYAAGHNAPILVTNGALAELPSDNMPVGLADRLDTFKLEKINFVPGSILYLYTDGYADQFGGPKGKKFKYKQLNALLLENSSKPIKEQKLVFEKTFENWKGDLEQIDDVLLIGIKI